ncbi:MAG: hypothetical protein LBL36_04240 [Clostridiales Family XIII bacterium]|jgi:hypothetical protein|nr:hypothetical protein [Clostridiales Family XIII bacterium]
MNNNMIAQSLARIEPSEPAQERMLERIFERANANDAQTKKARSLRKTMKWLAPVAACMAIAITAAVGYQADWFRSETPADPAGKGVFIPAIELPENTDDAHGLRLGSFIYQGRIYGHALNFNMVDKTLAVEDLVGEWIGFAKGYLYDYEGSKPEDYAEEFAGTVSGDVYTVRGYDPEFRLCMKESSTDDDGNYFERVEFYENLNGIHLMTGADLFGDRLKLRGNWTQIKFQQHDDWNWGRNILNDLTGVSDNEINAFIDELYSSDFEEISTTIDNDFFDESRHVYFYMNDNTVIGLRLFGSGYVGYESLAFGWWYVVKMPGEAFDKIFTAAE